MMNKKRHRIIYLLVLSLVSSSWFGFTEENTTFSSVLSNRVSKTNTNKVHTFSLTLEKVMTDHPYVHFKKVILANDLRCAGVEGYGLYCPGIDDYEIIEKYGCKKIEGTTEGNISYEM